MKPTSNVFAEPRTRLEAGFRGMAPTPTELQTAEQACAQAAADELVRLFGGEVVYCRILPENDYTVHHFESGWSYRIRPVWKETEMSFVGEPFYTDPEMRPAL